MGGELDTASRYCRNPGGLGERPWCFVYDDLDSNFDLRWEYCDIPECGEYDGAMLTAPVSFAVCC